MTSTDWSRFRVESISWATFLKRNLIHHDLLAAAMTRGSPGILEVGIGSGAQSAALSRRGALVVALDNDRRILEAARPNLDRFGRHVRVVAGDAFHLPFRDGSFGVAISQGLLEHFDDASIGSLLVEQLRVCRSVVFSVPSNHYPRQDVGDERLMRPEQWAKIVERALPSGGYHVFADYYRTDLESLKYSVLARRRLGGFSVLVTIDPAG